MTTVDPLRLEAFAHFFQNAPDVKSFDFCTTGDADIYPPRGSAGLVDYFFFNAGHQFGFWHLSGRRYDRPMIARVDGVMMKGSDYVSHCLTRALRARADFFAPARMIEMDDAEWNAVFADDEGINPLPQWDDHIQIIRAYAKWFSTNMTTPSTIVNKANSAPRPLATFLQNAGAIPGYAEDPLRKKLLLLAIMLENRPEHFLHVTDPDSYEPIIDYHLQRSALRTGLVRVDDPALLDKIVRRETISADDERRVRQATFDAVNKLVRMSGKSVAAIDYFFFMNRKRCPEMTEPECATCPVNAICAHQTKLFQPVFRTTAY